MIRPAPRMSPVAGSIGLAPLLALLVSMPLACGSDPLPPLRAPVGAHLSTTAEDARRDFWSWFAAEELRLAEVAGSRACVEVEAHLEHVSLDLTCEVLGRPPGARQLVIGASGKRSAFPSVRALIAAAPTLTRWEVVALRQRRVPIRPAREGDVVVGPDEVEFALFPEGRKIGIALYFDRALMDDPLTMRRIGFQLLDDALGEEDVTEHAGQVDWRPKGTSGVPRRTLVDLAAAFDAARGKPR